MNRDNELGNAVTRLERVRSNLKEAVEHSEGIQPEDAPMVMNSIVDLKEALVSLKLVKGGDEEDFKDFWSRCKNMEDEVEIRWYWRNNKVDCAVHILRVDEVYEVIFTSPHIKDGYETLDYCDNEDRAIDSAIGFLKENPYGAL